MSRPVSFVAACALLITACSGPASSAGDIDRTSVMASAPEATSTERPATIPYGRQMVAWAQTVERETARCMAERGFDYIPCVPQGEIDRYLAEDERAGIEVAVAGLDELVLPFPYVPATDSELAGREEAARTAGFGVFLQPEVHVEADPKPGPENPNAAIFAKLNPEEKAEYTLALEGIPPEDDSASDDVESAAASSCVYVGLKMAGPEPKQPGQLSDIDVDRLSTLGERVSRLAHADPAMTAAEKDYVACLAERGTPADPIAYVDGLLGSEIQRLTGDEHGLLEETGQGWEADLAAALGAEKLRAYQKTELAAAAAFFERVRTRYSVERNLLLQYQEAALRAEPDVAAMLGIDLDG